MLFSTHGRLQMPLAVVAGKALEVWLRCKYQGAHKLRNMDEVIQKTNLENVSPSLSTHAVSYTHLTLPTIYSV